MNYDTDNDDDNPNKLYEIEIDEYSIWDFMMRIVFLESELRKINKDRIFKQRFLSQQLDYAIQAYHIAKLHGEDNSYDLGQYNKQNHYYKPLGSMYDAITFKDHVQKAIIQYIVWLELALCIFEPMELK